MKLNPSQQYVADFKGGALLVLAPPGSGKTASITQRSANLIKAGLPPEKLLLVTFSRKACEEMSERISKLVETPPTILTLHKLGRQIVIENPEVCGRLRGVETIDNA
jgi:superfamily I DNA/RNA helicase